MEWLQQNIGTAAVCAVIAVLFGAILWKMIRDKKQGKSSCSCGCSGCAMKDQCHKEQ